MIIHVKSYDEFKEYIENNDCFVDFFATWCGPCKMLTPVIEDLDANGLFGDIKILKVDVDENGDIARDYRIQAVPTLMMFRGGKVVNTAMGYKNENELLDFIK